MREISAIRIANIDVEMALIDFFVYFMAALQLAAGMARWRVCRRRRHVARTATCLSIRRVTVVQCGELHEAVPVLLYILH